MHLHKVRLQQRTWNCQLGQYIAEQQVFSGFGSYKQCVLWGFGFAKKLKNETVKMDLEDHHVKQARRRINLSAIASAKENIHSGLLWSQDICLESHLCYYLNFSIIFLQFVRLLPSLSVNKTV